MARLIDADALMTDLDQTIRVSAREKNSAEMRGIRKVLDRIKAAPTISPDEVRGDGEWIPAETELGFSCSVCGKLLDEYVHGGEWVSLAKMPNYCPNCGAKMKGEQ